MCNLFSYCYSVAYILKKITKLEFGNREDKIIRLASDANIEVV